MYCRKCGQPFELGDVYCANCGRVVSDTPPMSPIGSDKPPTNWGGTVGPLPPSIPDYQQRNPSLLPAAKLKPTITADAETAKMFAKAQQHEAGMNTLKGLLWFIVVPGLAIAAYVVMSALIG